MKKILLLTRPICSPWDEGSKNFAYTLAKYASDFEIHILTCGSLADLADNIVQHQIYTSPKLDFSQKFRLFKFLKKANDFDIIHSLFTPTKLNSFFIKFALKSKKAKFIQTVATLREDLYSEGDFKKILFGDQIITYSDYAKEKLEKMGFDKIKRIYPGIDIEKYSPSPKNQELMKKLETSEDDFVINYAGEYVRLGDMDDIIETFIGLVETRLIASLQGEIKKNFKLHLAVRVKNEKDANKKKEIIKKLERENILDRVAFIDDGSYEMQDIFNLCDISIFPARTMAGKFDIPLAVIEAMACGKPVVASNLERIKYFLSNENSILIAPGNREVLKENILYLYNNPEKRYDLAKKAIRFVRENFDIMKVVKEYEEVYEKL
ncbi:MAG: glycosyltransferase family 4 protein [Candidatus Moraniibacteriota bacterium]